MTDGKDLGDYAEQAASGIVRTLAAVNRWKWRGIALLFLLAGGSLALIGRAADVSAATMLGSGVAVVGVLIWLTGGRR